MIFGYHFCAWIFVTKLLSAICSLRFVTQLLFSIFDRMDFKTHKSIYEGDRSDPDELRIGDILRCILGQLFDGQPIAQCEENLFQSNQRPSISVWEYTLRILRYGCSNSAMLCALYHLNRLHPFTVLCEEAEASKSSSSSGSASAVIPPAEAAGRPVADMADKFLVPNMVPAANAVALATPTTVVVQNTPWVGLQQAQQIQCAPTKADSSKNEAKTPVHIGMRVTSMNAHRLGFGERQVL
jgi:hypothetical protein